MISSMFPTFSSKSNPIPTKKDINDFDFRDCKSVEEKTAWLHSIKGQRVLADRPRLMELYNNGKIFFMITDPAFNDRLNEWLSLQQQSKLSLQHRVKAKTVQDLIIEAANRQKIVKLSQETKLNFVVDGYCVIKDIIPPEIADAAIKHINCSLSKENFYQQVKQSGDLTSFHSSDISILSLYYATDLVSLIRVLLHNDSLENHGSLAIESMPKVHGGQVALRFPEPKEVPIEGMKLGDQWHIDGMESNEYNAFTILVGIVLSDQSIPYSGNLCLHPNSHYLLQNYMKSFANGNSLMELHRDRPDLKEPVQILAKKGDVVIVSHKVAHRGGPNYNCEIRRMIYFRISHRYHDQLKEISLEDPWIEFEGLQDVL